MILVKVFVLVLALMNLSRLFLLDSAFYFLEKLDSIEAAVDELPPSPAPAPNPTDTTLLTEETIVTATVVTPEIALVALEEESSALQVRRSDLSQFLDSFLETQAAYLELLQQQVDTEREEEGNDENIAKNAEIRNEVVKEFQTMLQQQALAPALLAYSS